MASNQFNDGGESWSTIFNLTAEWSLGWADLIVSTGNYHHDITYGEETRSGFVRPGFDLARRRRCRMRDSGLPTRFILGPQRRPRAFGCQ